MTGGPTTNGFFESGSIRAIPRQGHAEVGVSWLIEALVDALAPRLLDRLQLDRPLEDRWMDSAEAASYLGISKNALHKLSSSKAIPLEQESPGCKLWFRRSDLDVWRRGERRVDG